MPRQVLVLDSSQISAAEECDQLHQYEYVENLIPINKWNPDATFQIPDHIAIGTLGHKYLEIYYKALALVPENPAFAARTALNFDPDKADKIDPEFPLDPAARAKCRKRFEDYIMRYAGTDYSVGTRPRAIITVDPETGMLQDSFEPEPLVEQGFSYPLLDSSEYLFVLEGRIDFIGTANGEWFWMDHKWQGRERELYSKSIQFRNYTMVTGFNLGIVNYVRLHEKITNKTFVRQPISFSTQELRYWKEELIEIYVRIAKSIANDGTERRRNRSACAGKFGYACHYTSLCDTYSIQQREAIKKMDFTKKREWRPW